MEVTKCKSIITEDHVVYAKFYRSMNAMRDSIKTLSTGQESVFDNTSGHGINVEFGQLQEVQQTNKYWLNYLG